MAKSIEDQIAEILEEYLDEGREIIEEVSKDVADRTAKRLKETSPRSKGGGEHYANGWKVSEQKSAGQAVSEAVVYNATKPQLTHLLSRSHVIKNQYGTYGRSTPDPHIDNAEEFGVDLFEKELERKL